MILECTKCGNKFELLDRQMAVRGSGNCPLCGGWACDADILSKTLFGQKRKFRNAIYDLKKELEKTLGFKIIKFLAERLNKLFRREQ